MTGISTQHRASPRVGPAPTVGAVVALIIAGCAGVDMERAAPPITGATLDAASFRGSAAPDVARGREVFVSRCGECHTLQPPASKTEQQWREILPRMARRARLNADDARGVEAYIFAARGASLRSAGTK